MNVPASAPHPIIPRPRRETSNPNATPFTLSESSRIVAASDATSVAEFLAGALRPLTGLSLPVVEAADAAPHDIVLALSTASATDNPEAYSLTADATGVRISATASVGLFYGAQTLRQLFPVAQEGSSPEAAEWVVEATTIEDAPRFAYRGAMLDVVRHFFGVDEVKRFIDNIAFIKINHLHLHLTDDQGWRIHIESWPKLTSVGAANEVGGGAGGFYTRDDYAEIVRHAASRFITVVPEIDIPGHTNAALVSYPELAPEGIDLEPYTGTKVGFSTLAISNERVYDFLTDVFREVSEMTPGPFVHIGGDESLSTTEEDFLRFVPRATRIAASHGKTVIGWHEIGRSEELTPGTIGQYWDLTTPRGAAGERAQSFVKQGGSLIMSPGDTAYLDIKYDENTVLGLVWPGKPTSIEESYSWDPAAVIPGVDDDGILGVEAPLWTESVTTSAEIDYMVFPRLLSIAEIGWSPRRSADDMADSWVEYSKRLAAFAPRMTALGIQFNPAAGVAWPGA